MSGITADSDVNRIEGASDGTEIGNVGDKLKVITDDGNNVVPAVDVILLDGSTQSLSVDGSTVNVNYEYAPGTGVVQYLSNLSFYFGESGGMAYNKFDNSPILTNGLKIEIKSKGTVYEFANLIANPDIAMVFFGGSSTSSKNSWEGKTIMRNIKLDGDEGDYVRAIVRDNLLSTTWISMDAKVWEVI